MNLLKALATVSGMTLISRVLGYVRDAVIVGLGSVVTAVLAALVADVMPQQLLRVLFAITLAFLLLTFLLLMLILTSRIVKTRRSLHREDLRKAFQPILSELLFGEIGRAHV